MNSFESIRLVLFRESDLRYRIASDIVSKALSMKKIVLEYVDDDDLSSRIDEARCKYKSKEVLVLKEFPGRKFQKCPCSSNVIGCNYYLLNTCFNCLFNCTYCFLNSYLNSYGITQFINIDDIGEALHSHCSGTDRIVRVGTGEFTDSLMFDDATSIAADLIESTASIKNLFLEFKTKSSSIGHLENVKKRGNAVLAWSINTQRMSDLYEDGTALISERIFSAKRAQELGFITAFHFDPIIMYENFISEYFDVIENMAESLSPERTAWISLGCFRYSPGFKDIIKHNFPDEKLTVAEMFLGVDGKFRYLTKNRIEIFRRFKDKLEKHFPDVYVYLCMEDGYVWREVFSKEFKTSDDLEIDFNSHLKNKFSLL